MALTKTLKTNTYYHEIKGQNECCIKCQSSLEFKVKYILP